MIQSPVKPSPLNFSWLATMAWRDSRRNRSRLLLFVSSIITGIAALVAIYSLGDNMRDNIDNQAATLLGADLRISANRPLTPEIKAVTDSLGGAQSLENSFASMVLFPKNNGSRLVQVRALQGAFPYYGELETVPASAGKQFRNARQALVDQSLMLQYNAQVGDSVRVGELNFRIAGSLLKAPGQTGISASVAPVVYIPYQYLDQTGLMQKGSRITYRLYVKLNSTVDTKRLVDNLEPRMDAAGFDLDTVESQKESTGRSFRDLTRFLSLAGFIALLLGCIGVASAIHIYVKEKQASIAILRCLGATQTQAILIYLLQITGIGLLGSVVGALLGTVLQQFLPFIIQDFLPIELHAGISWRAIGQGLTLGIVISILFALLPLVSIRKISPLNVLRVALEPAKSERDPFTWLVYALILAFVYIFTWIQTNDWKTAIYFTAGIVGAFLVLTGMANALIWAVRRFFPASWSYLWRQGLANLFRPNNQTIILIISVGLGTALICTLFFVQGILLSRIKLSTEGNQPNIVLFDIQPAQRQPVMDIAGRNGLAVNATVPIVNMRLEKVNSLTAAAAMGDTSAGWRNNMFSREYRVTFRDSLISSETIADGEWQGVADDRGEAPRISLEEGFARRNKIRLGDTMLFNVQGAMVSTVVGSTRQVNWTGIRPNFLVLFPKGVLEEAPQFHVLLTHVPTQAVSVKFQQAVVQQFPNVSIIDLGLVLKVLDDLFNKIGFVIRFMAGFSILTGMVVLFSSVLISKYQRLREIVLLRTLGASRKQVFVITILEYFFLGALASFTGILLALAASWGLAKFSFQTSFNPPLWPVLLLFVIICFLTVIIGLANSRSLLNRPPLEVLRQEV